MMMSSRNRHNFYNLLIAAGLAATALFAPSDVRTESPNKKGARALVLAVRGDARVQLQSTGPGYKTNPAAPGRVIQKNTTLAAGAEIRTGKKSSVTLQLSPTLMCRIGENTVLRLETLSGKTRLQLKTGSVGARVQPNTGTQMQVVTPTAVAGVRGTEFIVESDAGDISQADEGSTENPESRVLVNEGTVAVSPANDETASRDVGAGNKIVSDGENLKLSILAQFEKQKFSIFDGFEKLKKKNYEAYLEQVRRNEELKEQMEQMRH